MGNIIRERKEGKVKMRLLKEESTAGATVYKKIRLAET
jgi:hypothetical protein